MKKLPVYCNVKHARIHRELDVECEHSVEVKDNSGRPRGFRDNTGKCGGVSMVSDFQPVLKLPRQHPSYAHVD